MQFSVKEKKNLENVYSSLHHIRKFKRSQYGLDNRRRLYNRTRGCSPSIGTSPSTATVPLSLQPSLNTSPFFGFGENLPTEKSDLLNQQSELSFGDVTIEKDNVTNELKPMEDLIKMVLTGNKDKFQNKTEFFDALKNVSPERFMECFKTLGEKIFDEKDTTQHQENPQLATPMTTPLDNVFLDESTLAVPLLGAKESDDATMISKTPSVDLMNLNSLPSLDSTVIPSPDIFSPLQSSMTPIEMPELQQTPFEKPSEDVITGTPLLDQMFKQPMIVTKDELNPFKSPAPIVDPMTNLLAPSPVITSPLEALLEPSPVQSPFNDNSHTSTSTQDGSSLMELSNMLNTISNQTPVIPNLIPESPFQGSTNSFIMASPALQKTSSTSTVVPSPPFVLPVVSNTPNISKDTFVKVDDVLATPSPAVLSDQLTASPVILPEHLFDNVNLTAVANAPIEPLNLKLDEGKDTNLERVDLIMKAFNDILNNDTIGKDQNNTGCVNHDHHVFPSLETIKQCKVKENEFEFTNENITKLVRLSPIEVVQEDVIELEKLAKQKRGKGRPRKPRKYSICPFTSCHKKFNREFNLKEHIRIHNPKRNKEFVCQWCNDSFYSSSVLSRHISSIHQGEKFYCKNCGKKFNRKDALHRHEKVSCHFSN